MCQMMSSVKFIMKSKYHRIGGEHEDRIAASDWKVIDGRWLLAAQHLESWSQLWAPQHADLVATTRFVDIYVNRLQNLYLASYS